MSVIAAYDVSAANPSVLGGISVGIKYFQNKPTASSWNAGVVGVNSSVDSSQLDGVVSATNATGQLSVPSIGKLNGLQFKIRASGIVVLATAGVTISLRAQTTQLFAPSYTTIAQALNNSLAPGSYPWSIDMTLEGDSTTGVVGGYYTSLLNLAFANSVSPVPVVIADATLQSINFSGLSNQGGLPGPTPPFGLVIGVTFFSSSANNSASLYEFKIVQD